MQDHAQDAVLAAIGKNMAVTGGSASVIGGLATSDLMAVGGFLVAVVGVCIQWYYKRKADKRDEELHAERLKDLRHNG